MHTNKSSRNYLVNAAYNGKTSESLFRIAFRLARNGKKVLYIAAKSPDSLPIDNEHDEILYRDVLMNIVFSYSTNATELIKFFLGMKQFQPKPDVIVVDFLHTFFGDLSQLDNDKMFQKHFIDSHMLMTASLHSTVDMLSYSSRDMFVSFICIDPECHNIYKRFIQTYVDLYYYKHDCILSINDALQRFA